MWKVGFTLSQEMESTNLELGIGVRVLKGAFLNWLVLFFATDIVNPRVKFAIAHYCR